jgi:hypothetical protein
MQAASSPRNNRIDAVGPAAAEVGEAEEVPD